MFRSLLFLHWKQVRYPLALMFVGAFAVPLIMVGDLGVRPGAEGLEAYRVVDAVRTWVGFFPITAILVGATLALTSWNWDHQFNHVYALSLPISRWGYTLNKLLAGFLLAVIPTVGLWIGSLIATASIDLPAGLQAYPTELSVRFLFATMLVYSLFFALAAGTKKTALLVLGGILGTLFFGAVVNGVLAQYFVFFYRVNVVQILIEWLLIAPGPFEVFTGSWSLIDV